MKLTEIIFLNDVIQRHRAQGAKVQMIMVRATDITCVYCTARVGSCVPLTIISVSLLVVVAMVCIGELGLSAAAVCPVHQQ